MKIDITYQNPLEAAKQMVELHLERGPLPSDKYKNPVEKMNEDARNQSMISVSYILSTLRSTDPKYDFWLNVERAIQNQDYKLLHITGY